MRVPFGNPRQVESEIGGRFRPSDPGQGEIVRPVFGAFAKIIWPHNTDAHIATVAQCDPRTARRYLAGEIEAPAIVWVAMWNEAIRRGRLSARD